MIPAKENAGPSTPFGAKSAPNSAPDEHGVRPMESVPVFVFILAVTRKNASQDAQDDRVYLTN
jgi:hypothetical protein